MKHVVSMEWLASRLGSDDIRIVDCRFYMGTPARGLKEYIIGHLPNALYFDLELDLSAPVEQHGGRHPLPNMDEYIDKLSTAGIDKKTTVIAYDDQDGAMAARFWWMMRYLGHERVYVMDGGYTKWKEAGYPTTTDVPLFPRKPFVASYQPQLLATVEDVKHAIATQSAILIDSRERNRFLGIEEPIDCIAGHIPSAINIFWREGLTKEGYWKSKAEQEQRFADIPKNKPIIVYCGSGVTACSNVLAMCEAGFTNVKLYVGSWSDWISYSDNPIVREKN